MYFDALNGVAGTQRPTGTAKQPSNNITDLNAILAARNLKTIKFLTGVDLDAELYACICISAMGMGLYPNQTFNPNGNYIDECAIIGFYIDDGGVNVSPYHVSFVNCRIANLLDVQTCFFDNCVIGTLRQADEVSLFGCTFETAVITNNGFTLDVWDGRGVLTLKDAAAGWTYNIHLRTGQLTLDASCAGGTFYLYGDFELIDHSTGTTIIDRRSGGHLNSRFFQESAPAANANGTNWVDLLNRSTINRPVKICGFTITVAGGWAGNAQVRIVDGAGNKIFPFQGQWVEVTDFNSGVPVVFNFPLEVSPLKGYKFQFCSSSAADGAGKTMALTALDVEEKS